MCVFLGFLTPTSLAHASSHFFFYPWQSEPVGHAGFEAGNLRSKTEEFFAPGIVSIVGDPYKQVAVADGGAGPGQAVGDETA